MNKYLPHCPALCVVHSRCSIKVPVTEPYSHLPGLCLHFSSLNPYISIFYFGLIVITILIFFCFHHFHPFVYVIFIDFFPEHLLNTSHGPGPVLRAGVTKVERTWLVPSDNSQSRREEEMFELRSTL